MAKKPNTNRSVSIIPAASAQAVEPKPTKPEIIEALTRLKIEEQDAAREKAKAAFEAQRGIVLDLALKHSADLPLSAIDKDLLEYSYSHNTIEVSFKFVLTPQTWGADREIHVDAPADLKKAWEKANELQQAVPNYPYYRNEGERYREIRKEIAASLTRDSAGRVSRLLADTASRAALTDLLHAVEAGTEKRLN